MPKLNAVTDMLLQEKDTEDENMSEIGNGNSKNLLHKVDLGGVDDLAYIPSQKSLNILDPLQTPKEQKSAKIDSLRK